MLYALCALQCLTREGCILGSWGMWWASDWRQRTARGIRVVTCALAWLVFAWGVPLDASAQQTQISGLGALSKALTQYKMDTWQSEQGLPLNTVPSLLQTRDGYLWVGTGGGLARFDGHRFTTFDPALQPEIAAQPIFGLMEDAQGRLWIGYSRGAVVYENGKFRSVITRDMTEGRRVWAFAQASDGAIWMATENGLIRWDKGNTKIYQQADGLPTNRLRSLVFDRDGVLWIGTTGGGLVAMVEGRFKVYDPSNGFAHAQVRSVLADPQGGIWAATAGGGLVRVEHEKFTTYTTAEGLPTDQLTSLARDAHGTLWIGTWGAGVVRMLDGKFTSISTSSGLAGNQIWSVQVDTEGSVWVGTWVGGLNRLRDRTFVMLGTPEGLTHDNTRSVLQGRNGVTWVSTAGGGVNRIEGGRITSWTRKNGLPTEEVSSLFEDQSGALWIGTYTAGVVRLDKGRLETFGVAQGIPNVDVRSIFEDRSGTLWVGTQSGLARFDGRKFGVVQEPGAPKEGVAAMLQDKQGTLWFGTTGEGLVRYRDGQFSTLTKSDGLVSNWIMALYEDADSTLWIGTNGEGMNRLKDGRITAIRATDGLWDSMALSILEDGSGNLWMTCNRGFYRVSRADLNAFAQGQITKVRSTGFGPGDALRGTTFAGGLQPASAKDAYGNLWLPSSNGLVIVDPKRLPRSGKPPAVHIENVVVDGVSSPAETSVVLPPGSVPLLISYTAMTLQNAERVRFRYQMDGTTRGWVDAGQSREASFPALPHGKYVFRVAASIDGKSWSETEQVLSITVKPFFYQTAWFLAMVFFATVATAIALYRLRTHHLLVRQLQMETLIAQRTEELRLANEHLSRLSYLDALTGLANRRRFDEALETEWRRASRSQTPLALIMADIDGFKLYNDMLGHPEGDRCLAAVAAIFLQSVGRAGDVAARYGGEEFVVLMSGASYEAAHARAERLRIACEALAISHPAAPVSSVITLSLGVATCIPTDSQRPQDLVAQADAALYRAKQEGRNRVC